MSCIKKTTMALKNKKTKEKEDRNLKIISDFKSMIKIKGSQRMAIYEELSSEYGVSVSSVGRIVNK